MYYGTLDPRLRLCYTLPCTVASIFLLVSLYAARHHRRALNFNGQSCAFSVVYNKPHKTAGSKIQADILAWANATGSRWRAVTCTPYDFNLRARECVPDDPAGCVIVSNHMMVTRGMERILVGKLGKVLWMTSTRSGRERRLSHFLQAKKLKGELVNATHGLRELKEWLRIVNPWSDYSYMHGHEPTTKCPLSWTEQNYITDMVSRYDIVIDVDLPDVSNTILRHFGLFQLSDSFRNVRGASSIVLDEEAEQLLKKVTCVDDEMHRQFRVRMGSLYQHITGEACLNSSRLSAPCF